MILPEIFGKIMSVPDVLMPKYFELLTDCDLAGINTLHPKDAKVKLAKEIIAQYYSAEEATKEAEEFQRVFAQKELPQDIPEYKVTDKNSIVAVLVDAGLVNSGNEARRLLKQGAVLFNDEKVQEDVSFTKPGILKVGSRRFLKIII